MAEEKNKKKPVLVFVNPASGTKLATKMYTTILKPALDSRGLRHDMIKTQYAGHARELIQGCADLQRYSAFIIVSGDGLVYEVTNGIYSRQDWDDIGCKIPLGLIPGGSGNALNCSLLRQLD